MAFRRNSKFRHFALPAGFAASLGALAAMTGAAAHDHHPGSAPQLEQTAVIAVPKTPGVPKKRFKVTDEGKFVEKVCRLIEKAATRQKLPPAFLAKLIWKESRFDPNAISPKGAEGIAQFMPFTAAAWGLKNAFEPVEAIDASSRLLGYLARGYGNLGLAAAAYNAGERRVDLWKSGKSGLPAETQDYVYSITGYRAKEWTKPTPPPARFVLDEVRSFQTACTQLRLIRAPLQRRFANTYYNRGLALTRKKDFVNAINRYSVAIRLKPIFPHAYNNRGIVYRKIGDYKTAIANYDAAIRQKADYAVAYNNRGYAKRKLGQFEAALADYDKAIKHRSNYVAAYFNRGFANAKMGRTKEAIADYTTAIKLRPKHALALYNRARAKLEIGKKSGAESDFTRAIAVEPKFAKAYYRRAALRQSLGKRAIALKDYKKSVALNPAFGTSRYHKPFR